MRLTASCAEQPASTVLVLEHEVILACCLTTLWRSYKTPIGQEPRYLQIALRCTECTQKLQSDCQHHEHTGDHPLPFAQGAILGFFLQSACGVVGARSCDAQGACSVVSAWCPRCMQCRKCMVPKVHAVSQVFP